MKNVLSIIVLSGVLGLTAIHSNLRPVHAINHNIMASEVVDRETLRGFVYAAKMHIENLGKDVWEFLDKEARVEGHWKHGSIYLFIGTEDGVVRFHGANPGLEGQNLMDLEDSNGVKITHEIIKAANRGGDYIEHLFDNPAVEGDEKLGSPKVTYATFISLPEPGDDKKLIIGSGFFK